MLMQLVVLVLLKIVKAATDTDKGSRTLKLICYGCPLVFFWLSAWSLAARKVSFFEV